MPTIPQQQTIVQYITNSLQLTYTFAFYAPLPTDINVYYQAPNTIPVPSSNILLLNTQYTVTYNSDPTTGGYITLLFTPTTGYYLTINRNVIPTLTTNFSDAQNFNGENLDAALDRLLLLIQQNLNYILERNLSYIINSYLPNPQAATQLPTLAQNYVWIGSGSGVTTALLASSPSASILQSLLANQSAGTDGARLVGYYDVLRSTATTVDANLTLINSNVNTNTSNIATNTANIATNTSDIATLTSTVNSNNHFYGGSIYISTNQNITATTPTKLAFDTVNFNPSSLFSAPDNGFKINKVGYYRFSAAILGVPAANTADNTSLSLYKNGNPFKLLGIQDQENVSNCVNGTVSDLAALNDIYTLYINNLANNTVVQANVFNSTFECEFIGQ